MNAYLLVVRNQISCYCGPKDGGRYDLDTSCAVCGSGARRLDPIHLPSTKLKDRVTVTLKYEFLIPFRLVEPIRSVAPGCLREILDEKTNTPTQYFELISERALPRFAEDTSGYITEKQCPNCKRDGFFNVPNTQLKLSYRGGLAQFSVAETYERFGNSRLRSNFKESNFAVPYLVVGDVIKKLLSNENGVEFVPVTFKVS